MGEGLQKVVPTDDTIVAISTPFGRSGIGVVRLSGKDAVSIARRFFHSRMPMSHRGAAVGVWKNENAAAIDEVIATLFQAPHSYTGEDVVEISAHGNPLILRHIVESVQSAGARMAGAGEFTLRAVLHGKMDLMQAEAVRDFIEAQTEMQTRIALQQMGGALSRRIQPCKERLVDIIAQLEAGIDFADDDVMPPNGAEAALRLDPVLGELEELRQSYSFGRIVSAGLRLAIVGKPNVGKSSLFNRLLGSERAIVTATPGTTRDVLRETVSLDGVPLQFLDTAGVRETVDPVESIGVARSWESMSEADLVLVVLDGSAVIDDADRSILARIREAPHLIVVNKCDLLQCEDDLDLGGASASVHVSAKSGEGMDGLKHAIGEFLGRRGEGTPGSIVTSARHEAAIASAIGCVQRGRAALIDGTPHEMVLLDLYQALAELNELTGDVVTEDILGRIFSTFCVGK